MGLTLPITTAALDHAEKYANAVKLPDHTSSGSSSTPVEHPHHYHRSNLSFFSYQSQTVSMNQYSGYFPYQQEESASEKWGVLAALVGAAIALAGAYFLGRDLGDWSQANQELSDLDRTRRRVKSELTSTDIAISVPVKEVLHIERQMIQSVENQAKIGVMLKTALVVSAFVLAIGGFFASAPLMGGGILGTLGFGVASMVRWGFQDIDKSLSREADHLLAAVQDSRRAMIVHA